MGGPTPKNPADYQDQIWAKEVQWSIRTLYMSLSLASAKSQHSLLRQGRRGDNLPPLMNLSGLFRLLSECCVKSHPMNQEADMRGGKNIVRDGSRKQDSSLLSKLQPQSCTFWMLQEFVFRFRRIFLPKSLFILAFRTICFFCCCLVLYYFVSPCFIAQPDNLFVYDCEGE